MRLTATTVALLCLCAGVDAGAGLGSDPLEDGPAGLHATRGLQMVSGPCLECASIPQALWYFKDDLVAAPMAGTPVAGVTPGMPAQADLAAYLAGAPDGASAAAAPLIWLGSPEVVASARLAPDGRYLRVPGGSHAAFATVAKIPSNRSYFDSSSLDFFVRRPLRLRGETLTSDEGQAQFVARTLWPLDFVITPDAPLQALDGQESFRALVSANRGGATAPFSSRLIWTREPGGTRDWHDKAVLAVMLNGAQGDDDEAHGGHFAIATGRFRSDGDWSRWLVYNFYNLNSYSEKGIVAAPTPMDKYLGDLNSGQSWYRPSYMLVAVLRQDRTALQYQNAIERVYNHFYRHDFEYDHSRANCSGVSMDTLNTLGWRPPRRGHEALAKAIGAYLYVAATSLSATDGRKIYDYLLEESTRLYPAAAFDALATDLLALANGTSRRALTPYERALAEDLAAIYYVHIPQFPSSRASGQAPV
ncbi:MAG: hypothetical protein JNJ60_18860, partial [Rhodocyclaceae bacterium]|nr:hypothetical protein [Rhodocyclaceae bacterium]